jgi:Flp pilus assembly pilin Flp
METLKTAFMKYCMRICGSGRGQGYVEYILIIALVCLAVTAALTGFAGKVSDGFAFIGSGV